MRVYRGLGAAVSSASRSSARIVPPDDPLPQEGTPKCVRYNSPRNHGRVFSVSKSCEAFQTQLSPPRCPAVSFGTCAAIASRPPDIACASSAHPYKPPQKQCPLGLKSPIGSHRYDYRSERRQRLRQVLSRCHSRGRYVLPFVGTVVLHVSDRRPSAGQNAQGSSTRSPITQPLKPTLRPSIPTRTSLCLTHLPTSLFSWSNAYRSTTTPVATRSLRQDRPSQLRRAVFHPSPSSPRLGQPPTSR